MAPRSSYHREEVQALVEGYCNVKELASVSPRRLWLLVRVADLDRALPRLQPVLRQALYLCGIVGLTRHEAGALLGVNEKTMDRRYSTGVDELTTRLNGGTTY